MNGSMPSRRPNILLILSDQQRLDTVGAYGLPPGICRTPHIDGLARRGVRFDQAFTPTAICSPARASLFTGRYPHRHGVTGNGCCIREGTTNFAEYLAGAGYRLGYAGKWHVDHERGPTDFGFSGKDFLGYGFPGSGALPGLVFNEPPLNRPNPYEAWLRDRGFRPKVSQGFFGTNPGCQTQEMFALHDGPVESSIEWFVADEANRLMEEMSGSEEPFFLWANFWGPHSPSLVPEPWFSMYDPAAVPEHPSYRETFADKPHVQRHIEKMWGLGDLGWKGFQEIAARYFGHCSLIDDMVGRMIATLERLGQLDNTVIIYASDHGDSMGAHKLIEKGEFMYDEIYRIPLVAAHPSCERPGTVCQEMVYLHDLTSTLTDLAGMGEPEEFDGRSLLRAALGRDLSWSREEVYCVFDRHFTVANQRMVRTRSHQLTFNSCDLAELYDLEKDPWQLTNVYEQAEYQGVRRDMLNRLRGYLHRLDDPVSRWFDRLHPPEDGRSRLGERQERQHK